MLTSTNRLAAILADLTERARARGWNDSEWARHAGLPKETLCRLRSRDSCDFRTLDALAWAVEARLEANSPARATTSDGLMPAAIDRADEDEWLALLAAPVPDERAWRAAGPAFFMAGLAASMAQATGADRAALERLAETLHPGITLPAIYNRWLALTPWTPGPARARVSPASPEGSGR